MIFRPEPVPQYESADADRIEPARNVGTFFLHRQVLIAASRADYHRGSSAAAGRNHKGENARLIGGLAAKRARSSVRPKKFDLGLIRRLCEKAAAGKRREK